MRKFLFILPILLLSLAFALCAHAATTQEFFLHAAATPDVGTLPGSASLSATTPNVSSSIAATNESMNGTKGTTQTSVALATNAVKTLNKNWYGRWVSPPLAAQTLPTGAWTIQLGGKESNANSNMLVPGTVIAVWRPSTGAVVATLLDNPALGTVEPSTSETNASSTSGSIGGVTIQNGDVLVVEIWAQNTQAASTSYTNTIYYDGTTASSTTSNAAYVNAPGAITLYAPAAPGTPTYTSVGLNGLTVNWTGATSSQYYIVQRSTNGNTFTQIATTTALSYTDSGLSVGTTYFYNVAGWNVNATGTFSASSSVSTLSSGSGYTWTNGGGDNNWNTANNWSGGSVPGPNNTAVFSASSSQNCTINTAVNVGGVSISSGYMGTIMQGSGNTMVVGSSSWNQSGGTFTGSSAGDTITINGAFILNSGATFTATTGDLYLYASSTFSGTFQNNAGIVLLGATSTYQTITGSSTFYDLWLGDGGGAVNPTITVATGTILTVTASTSIGVDVKMLYLEGGGEINAQGDVLLQREEEGTVSTSTFNFVLDGTGTQTVTTNGQGGFLFAGSPAFFLPSLTINKPSGVVDFDGLIGISGNWTNDDGASVMNPGTSTIFFGDSATSSVQITGSSTFNDLWFGDGFYTSGQPINITVATGTLLAANGSTTFGMSASMLYLLGGGELDAKGDVLLDGGGEGGTIPTSTFNIVLNGTGTQNVSDQGAGSAYYPLMLPSVTINKSSGSVNFSGYVDVTGNWTNDDAPATMNAGASTIGLLGIAPLVTGSTTFFNLTFGIGDEVNPHTELITVATGTVLTVQSATTMGADSQYTPLLYGGGEVDAQGNVLLDGFWLLDNVPTSTFNFVLDGTGTQLISDQGNSSYPYNPFPLQGLTINKPSGVAFLSAAYFILPYSLAITQGEFQLATGTEQAITVLDGPVTVSPSAVLSDYPVASSTLVFGSGVTNNGFVFFDGSGEGCTTILPNYVSLNSTTTGQQVPWSGSGNSVMRYVNVQDQAGTELFTVLNGTNSGDNGGNWAFSTGPEPELVQHVENNGGSGTTNLNLPLTFKPRAGDLIVVAVSAANQSIIAPTDNAGNTYTLISSSAFGSSPSNALSLYYAKNIITSSSLLIKAHGGGGSSPFLTASAFEYTGVNPSSTLDAFSANTDTTGSQTALTSFSATGRSTNELYFGAMTLAASTTAISGSGWSAEQGDTNNSTNQALYVEDQAPNTELTTAATWTAATSTSYAAIMGIFRAPYLSGYAASGTLDSATFDTGVASGTQLNSFIWQGATPSNTSVKFQFAVSNSASGPWVFEGPDGTANTYFSGNPNTPISLVATSNGYSLFSGYRYFRYRVTLFADSTFAFTPTVSQVVVSWSP